MTLNRRKFLALGGLAASSALAVALYRTLGTAESSGEHSQVSQPVNPVQEPALKAIAPAPKGLFAPARGDVRIVVISDLNSAYGSTSYEPEVTKAIELIPDWQPDLVLGGGDMVAGQDPSLSREEIQAMWAAFDQAVGAPLRKAQLPFGFTIGNHDASAATTTTGRFLFPDERELAAAHWRNPRHNPGLNFEDRVGFPFYYTFTQNDIFYLVWDASTSKIPPEQLSWAEKHLGGPEAQQAKLRIVIGHLPLYAVAVGRDEPGEILENAEQLRSLLERYRVHTYISGHHHAYYPGHRGKLELLHAGALGGGPRPLLNSELAPQKTLTVIDVNIGSETTTYTTYDMTTLQVVDQQKLPRLIAGPNGMVLRRDLEWKDLTPAQQSLDPDPASWQQN